MRSLTRREVLGLVAVLAAGCAGQAQEVTAPTGGTGAAGGWSRSVQGSGPGYRVPTMTPWQAGPGEVRPQVKELASALVQTAGSWTAGAHTVAALRTRLAAAGFSPDLAGAARPLLAEAPTASVEVTYPQYGGLSGGRASVMVTAIQTLVVDGEPTRRGHTVDVRLVQGASGASWVVEAVLPGVPAAASLPLTAERRAVLEDERIALPAAAAADIRAGVVDPGILAVLTGLADEHELTVTVLVTGHPREVFGTDRVSKHTLGRAVDIWAIDGHAVADPDTSPDLVASVMRRAAALGATEIGGPVDLDSRRGGTFFTDEVHHDHVHVGVRGPRGDAAPGSAAP
jgi:hypothetical protein